MRLNVLYLLLFGLMMSVIICAGSLVLQLLVSAIGFWATVAIVYFGYLLLVAASDSLYDFHFTMK